MAQSNELRKDALGIEELFSLQAKVEDILRDANAAKARYWWTTVLLIAIGVTTFVLLRTLSLESFVTIEITTSGALLICYWGVYTWRLLRGQRYFDLQTHVDRVLLSEVIALRQGHVPYAKVRTEEFPGLVNPGTEVAPVMERAAEVIGDREEAFRWMGTPVRALGYATPMSLLATPEGRSQVLAVLGRLEHGVL